MSVISSAFCGSPLLRVTVRESLSINCILDSGSQINVIHPQLLSQEVLAAGRFLEGLPAIRISGVFGAGDQKAKQWVRLPISFEADESHRTVETIFAVHPCSELMILGMPFIMASRLDLTALPLEDGRSPLSVPVRRVAVEADMPTPACDVGAASLNGEETKCLDEIMQQVSPALDHEYRTSLRSLLVKHGAIWRGNKRGRIHCLEHEIQLTTTKPVVQRPRRYNEEQLEAIDKEIEVMLADGVIVPSRSNYSSEIVMVLKKTGDWRVCVDFRDINKFTVDDKYPLPRISELLRAIKGSDSFITLDLRSGYWQIPLEEKSKKFTAFRTHKGLYEFKVMPFGLKTAPATFQRMMDFILADLRSYGSGADRGGVLVYIDDIMIHSSSPSICLHLFDMVAKRLAANNLTINLPKSTFFLPETVYLGHLVGPGYIKPNPKRVAALDSLKVPTTLSELRRCIGFYSSFRMYLPRFAEKIDPLVVALRDTSNAHRAFVASHATEMEAEAYDPAVVGDLGDIRRAMVSLKEALQSAVLANPVEGDAYVVSTDASDVGVGGILWVERDSQRLPVHFVSQSLNKTQKNWTTTEKEAWAIVFALLRFEEYLKPHKFVVETDHQALKALTNAQSGKLARWAVLMSEFQMNVVWRKGEAMCHVDCLSRDAVPDPNLQYASYVFFKNA